MDKRMIRVLIVAPGKHPEPAYLTPSSVLDIIGSLCADIKNHVRSKCLEEKLYVIYSKEGPLLDLQGNRRIDGQIITGLFFVVATDAIGNIVSLNDAELEHCKALLWEPEEFRYEEVLDAYFADKYEELDEFVF